MAEKVNPLYTAAIRLIKLRDSGKITKEEYDKRMGAAMEKHMVKSGKAKGGIIKKKKKK
tara:strand:- start:897 stop:1073 length:177 start_codon:yes stop_codon:yes gene_type:complete